jgi:hypothetical protein
LSATQKGDSPGPVLEWTGQKGVHAWEGGGDVPSNYPQGEGRKQRQGGG